MRLLVAALAAISLTGCAGFNAAQSFVADKGSVAADEIRDTAEFAICRGITVGAWVRAYGASPEKAQAWRVLCSQQVTETPAMKP